MMLSIGITEILLVINIVILIAMFIYIGSRLSPSKKRESDDEFMEKLIEELSEEQLKMLDSTEDALTDRISLNVSEIRQDINQRLYHDSEENRKNRTEISDSLSRGIERLDRSLKEAMLSVQESNRRKLEDIQADISKKLDTSLNERLDSSFKTVGEQLNRLYVSLGELSRLENGVSSLNRTLSNVKTRGIYGEMQLEGILEDILPNTLYDKNVVTKKSKSANRDAVEFAVKIPDKESSGAYMYLPIDSKFPQAAYEKIIDAQERADSAGLAAAVKELEQKVKLDARDIQTKYLDPPNTTDFGIMFLPTESLYAEVLRIPGLSTECFERHRVVITGPSTAAALISSLGIGFRYMAVNRDSKKVLKLLAAIKTQFGTLSELIQTADNRIELARKATSELQHRTDIINRRLSQVEELDSLEAAKVLGDTQ